MKTSGLCIMGFIVSLMILSFVNDSNLVNKDAKQVDSLKNIVLKHSKLIDSLTVQNAPISVQVVKSSFGDIILYKPEGLSISRSNIRPAYNEVHFLCVPAAYTTLNTVIDGLYLKNGVELNSEKNPKLNGICVLSGGFIRIINADSLDNKLLNKIKQEKGSMFQQSLLVENSKIIPCNLFKNNKNIRRALIEFKDGFCICQSVNPITISEFSHSLFRIGVLNAVNLDMASWSEGWYRNKCNEKIKIVEIFTNTNKQPNWLIYHIK